MKARKLHFILTVCGGLFLLQTSISAQIPTSTPEESLFAVKDSELNLIHPGDLIDIDVIGSVEYDWRGSLTPEGFLDGVDYAESPIYAFCRSEESVAAEVSKAYSRILRDPKVVVKILDRSNRPLSLLYGAVRTPQRLQIKRPILLNELLILAGGLTDKASGNIQIYRPGSLNCRNQTEKPVGMNIGVSVNLEKSAIADSDNKANYINIRTSDLLKGKKEANPQILSGDIITVQEAESVYVIGGVVNPGQVFLNGQLTLSRAVDSVGGIAKGGDDGKITVFRREAGESKIIEADLEKIRKMPADDILLRASDIVEVARRGSEKRKFPPILGTSEVGQKTAPNLPLRVID